MKGMVAIFILMLVAALFHSCGNPVTTVSDNHSGSDIPAPWDLVDEGEDPPPTNHTYEYELPEDSASVPAEDSLSPETMQDGESVDENVVFPELPPPDMTRYRSIGRLNELFNDSNKYQYAAGERIGIKPISKLGDAFFTRRPLVKLSSCRWYELEELTHSMPYLVPEAADLLETSGRNFEDSLRRRGLEGYRFRVTSVLRSAHSVKKLRRVNRNATDSSTHQLGTTFDISWSRFEHDGAGPQVSDAELKYILAEVLRDLRLQRRCLVKYEVKSPCFHITAAGK